ncbi:oligopeptidase A [Chitinivorax tropicus]|uniref:oligopeptidase A n=1 Tax=Chitinivorax tropicus TaxID=714531 RepID=A0A840MP61_9PROT|nr:M3 family metallopeptidase [Chitinivorax tropicus]MBB5020428.1 oligopeptidase A [Chitinivorax tropicus]
MNPLLDFTGLPKYNTIKPEHATPAIDQLLAENEALVERLTHDQSTPTWADFIRPLDEGLERLGRAWSQVSHLNSVVSSPEQRDAYNQNLPKITQFYSNLSQNLALYAKYKELKASAEWGRLNDTQRKIVDDELRDFVLGGAELPEEQKARFKVIQEELANLSAKFEEHLLDATDAFGQYFEDATPLAGLPDDCLAAAKEAAEADGKTGYKLTLQYPSYFPVMQYCHNRELRAEMYRAFVTRASEFGPGELDNTQLIDQILALRTEAAELLGYQTFAEISLATKMADTPDQVMRFLRDLASRSKPFAQKDWEELNAFARNELGMEKVEAWDVPYVSERLRVARYAFSDQEVRQYFPEPVVLDGLFKLLSTIYGVTIKPDQAEIWHKDVKFYRIEHDGQLIGQFYLDMYARTGKRGGAWMDDAIARIEKQGQIQTPVAYLVCNFSAPVGDKPALFTHDEVITLFHEAGHGLHHLMTHVSERPVSGINGVEWDAVELPSQFMENFCWEWDVLSHMTRHIDTGTALPRELFDKMLAAKNFQCGMQFARQLELGMFDMQVHTHFRPGQDKTILDVLDAVRKEVAVVIPPAFNRLPHSFSHIFAGGYAAGYYSYKWAEVLSADAYAAFEEQGVLNPEIGRRFWHEILAVGGSRPALESFKAFRGREPQIDALLRHNGMVAAA